MMDYLWGVFMMIVRYILYFQEFVFWTMAITVICWLVGLLWKRVIKW